MIITLDYFKKEYMRFREIMCSTEHTAKQKGDALTGLLTVYMNIKLKDGDDYEIAGDMMSALLKEYNMRMAYEVPEDY